LFWLIYLWNRRDPHRNTQQWVHFCGMERRRLQRHGHLFGRGYFQHLRYCDVHGDRSGAGECLWSDTLRLTH